MINKQSSFNDGIYSKVKSGAGGVELFGTPFIISWRVDQFDL